jgi:hypothetical protein
VLNGNISPLVHTALSERLFISLKTPEIDVTYPTSKIQKGPVIVSGAVDLCGEGVGLGVPVAKFTHRVVFPGKARVNEQRADNHRCTWVVDYELNLEELVTMKSGESIHNDSFYRLKEGFAGLHRAIPISRGLTEGFNRALRFMWRLSTTFEPTSSAGTIRVSYTVDRRATVLRVSVDASRLNNTGCTEIIFLNEQDGSLFDHYSDSNGLELFGKEIGTWEETVADCVTLSDSRHNISLSLPSVPRSTMYRGREVVPGRLSWTGVAYVLAPPYANFDYDITIREDV